MENATSTGKEQQEKLTLIDSFLIAMFSPKEYSRLLILRTGRIVGYLIVLMLLICIIQYAIPTLGAIAGMGGMKSIIENELPQFSLKNGEFFLEDKLEQIDEVAGIYIVVDTDVEQFTKEDIPENMLEAIMVSKSNIIVYNSMYGLGGIVDEQKFELYKDINLSNEILADSSIIIYFGLGCVFIGVYLVSMLKYLLMALFYAGFMFFVIRSIMPEVKFGTVYKITLFAQTIGGIVEAVTYCLNIDILIMAGSFFNVLVTVILMNKAMIQLKMNQTAD